MNIMLKIKRLFFVFFKYFTLVFFAFISLVPIVSCVITAFKTDEEYASTNVMEMPSSWLNFENFKGAWERANLGLAFLNSTIVLLCVLTGSILFGAMIAYVLSRYTTMPILLLYTCCQSLEIIKCIIGSVMVKKGIWINNIVADKKGEA